MQFSVLGCSRKDRYATKHLIVAFVELIKTAKIKKNKSSKLGDCSQLSVDHQKQSFISIVVYFFLLYLELKCTNAVK